MKKTLQITYTAVLTGMLVLLQSATKAGGQFVTGSCVNAVLAIGALFTGVWTGVAVAVISPFFAFMLGIGPQIIAIVPAIAVGNVIYVLVLHFLCSQKNIPFWRQGIGLLCSAACKFVALYLIVVQVLCRSLPLAEKQIAAFTTMFSWPQLITALIGGGIALMIVPILCKAYRR